MSGNGVTHRINVLISRLTAAERAELRELLEITEKSLYNRLQEPYKIKMPELVIIAEYLNKVLENEDTTETLMQPVTMPENPKA